MKCPKCNSLVNKIEPEQTYSISPKEDYKCPKCGTRLMVTKSNSATGADSIQIIFPELKDVTG